MEKNIYDLLNDTQVVLDDKYDMTLTKAETKKMKSNFKKSINSSAYKKAVSVAAAVILTVGILGTPLASYAYENVNLIVSNIASYLGIEKNLDDYSTVVNQAITRDGLTIQLNEVILDTDQLVVSTTARSDEKIEKGYIGMDSLIYINGKRINGGASGSSQSIDDYTVEEVINHQLDNADLSGDLDVKIMLLSAEVNGDTRRGPWVFEFKTNGDQLALDTHEIKLDYAFTLDNGQRIALEKYTSNDLGQKIYYSKNRQGTSYDIALQGKDDLGNKVEFFMTHEEDGKGIFKLSTIDGNLNDDARVLTLTPYAVKFPEQSGKLSNDYKPVGPEFTIDLVTPLHRDVLL
ncbi:DUF4179 domain-containing protein [Syntrophomonas wolfei]|mgnify:CR=1 FL=1|jgi:hypothetical protein|uniref:DUF4179 domain-containing protein n=1 Tax=Syntrophomonas wolfei TaxID=863 RepID=UPI0023F136BC|nr:DUF4179 domain-containing protein [Syntrophomonas wolfei]